MNASLRAISFVTLCHLVIACSGSSATDSSDESSSGAQASTGDCFDRGECNPTSGCDSNADQCESCIGDDDCEGVCDLSIGQCVECLEASDCPSTAPMCEGNMCVGCEFTQDCQSRSETLWCEKTSGHCVECLVNADCNEPGKSYCEEFTCVAESDNTTSLDSIEVDGSWCPMNHCNLLDNSLQNVPPLLELSTNVQKVIDARISPQATNLLGCYSGEVMAVCAYSSPDYPALAAFRYHDGEVLWMTPIEHLQGYPTRAASTVLMAKIGVNGNLPTRAVFAANPLHVAAYRANGEVLWIRDLRKIVAEAPSGLGIPTTITITDDKALIMPTSEGWLIKLNPVTGAVIDAYRMETSMEVDGDLYEGVLVTINSAPIIGNVLYLNAEFVPDDSNPLPVPELSPVVVLRVELSQPNVAGQERKIRPIQSAQTPSDVLTDRVRVGVHEAGGSPPAWPLPNGDVFIVSDADRYVDDRLIPSIAGVRDHEGTLELAWRTSLSTPGDDIVAAPSLDPATGTALVSTKKNLYVFHDVNTLSGFFPPPQPFPSSELLTCRNDDGTSDVVPASPFAVIPSPETHELIAYTNFRVTPEDGETYSYLGAIAVSTSEVGEARVLWCAPLGLSDSGNEIPGQGTYGQPVFFRYNPDGAPGVLANTRDNGTYFFR